MLRAKRGRNTGNLGWVLALALSTQFGLAGCSSTMSHAGVSNPIVLGNRLHIGSEAEAEFDTTEVLEEYIVKKDHSVVVSINGYATEKVDDPVVIAETLLHINRYRAVRNLEVRAGVIGLFVVVGGGGGAGLRGKGDVIEIIPLRRPRSEDGQ